MLRNPSSNTAPIFVAASISALIIVAFASLGSDAKSMSGGEWSRLISEGQRIGADDAEAVLLVFGTYACGYCAKFDLVLDSVLTARPTKTAVIMRSYLPIGTREQIQWHVAAECAGDQGRFDAYRSALFHQPGTRDSRNGWMILGRLSLIPDQRRFYACVQTQERLHRVQADTRAAEKLGVDRTPTWYLNGRRFVGAASRAYVDSLIEIAIDEVD